MLYPGNYGFIPDTLAGDGDPLDILLVCDYPIYPGVIVETKIIGVLIMEDEKGMDEKVIVVPSENIDQNYKDINELDDLPKSTIAKIKHFSISISASLQIFSGVPNLFELRFEPMPINTIIYFFTNLSCCFFQSIFFLYSLLS